MIYDTYFLDLLIDIGSLLHVFVCNEASYLLAKMIKILL